MRVCWYKMLLKNLETGIKCFVQIKKYIAGNEEENNVLNMPGGGGI